MSPQTKLDDLFFEITVRKGAGTDATISKFAGRLKEVKKGAQAAGEGLDEVRRRGEQTERSASKLGATFRRLLVIFGAFAAIRAATRAIVNFETRIAEISTIADETVTDVDALRNATIQLSLESPQSAEELGAGAYQILSSGVKDTADVIDVLRASSIAAVAGLTDTETAVDAVTTVLNAFGKPASEATNVTDVLFKTVELGKLRFGDLAQNIGNAATSAALAGVSFEELNAGIAVLTQRGINAAEATTSLNRLFLTLVSQTDEQKDAFARLGVEFNTATVAEKGFAGLLEELNELTAGQIDELAELFPNIRAARAAFILAGTGTEDFAASLDQLRNSTGAAQAAFETINKTFSAQAKILRNTLIAIFLEASQSTLPGLTAAFAFLSRNLRKFLGGIKLLGADLFVVQVQLEAFARAGLASFAEFISGTLSGIGDFVNKVADILDKISLATFPGAEAAGAIADGLRLAADSEGEFAEKAREAAAAAEQQLLFALEARDAVAAQVIAESEFAARRQATADITDALAQAEGRRAKLSQEQLEKRAELEQELADRVADITLSAAEAQIEQIKKLREAFEEAFPKISDSALAAFEKIEEAAEKALSQEKAQQLADGFRTALEEGLFEIEFEAISIVDDEERTVAVLQQQVNLFNKLLAQAKARLTAAETTTEEEKELRKVILDIEKALADAADGQEMLAENARRDAEERFRELQTNLSLINQSVNGALDLASAFGLVNEELAQSIDSLLQIGTGVATLLSSLATGNIAGIISGGLGALGGIAGLIGGDPAQTAALEANSKRLRELGRQIETLAGTFDITGKDFAAALMVLSDFSLEGIGGLDVLDAVQDLSGELTRLGLDFNDLQEIAQALGITIFDSAGNLIPAALEDLRDALLLLEDSLIGFPESIAGALDRFRLEIEFFDITDPIEQFALLQERLLDIQQLDQAEITAILGDETLSIVERIEKLTDALAVAGSNITPFLAQLLAIDVGTAEGQQEAQAILEQLFRDLVEGKITPEELGAATFEEAIAILKEMETLLDAIEEGGEDAGESLDDSAQDVRRNVQITELQGNVLLANLTTIAERATQTVQLLTNILAALLGQEVDFKQELRPNGPMPPEDLEDVITEFLRTQITLEVAAMPPDEPLPPELTDILARLLGEEMIQPAMLPPELTEILSAFLGEGRPADALPTEELADILSEFLGEERPAGIPPTEELTDILSTFLREGPAEDVVARQPEESLADILSAFLGEEMFEPVTPPPVLPPGDVVPPEEVAETIGNVIRDALEDLMDAGPMITPAGPMIDQVTINQEVNVGPGVTEEEVEVVRNTLVDELAEELGQRLIDKQRARGLRDIRRAL